VLVGSGQLVQRDVDPRQALDPVEMMLEVTRRAAEDARLDPGKLESLDRVLVPSIFGSHYSNAARLLAERLGAGRAAPLYLGLGGNGPQKALNQAARDVAAGRADFVLLASAEALDTRQRAREAGVTLDWSGGGAPTPAAPDPAPSSPVELRHRLMLPPFIYPLYENALRAHLGRDLEGHRRRVGAMLARFTATAAENPYAWFRTRRSADELTRPGPRNRMVAFPYTKYMNAILRVDQAAAVLLCSAGRARALGIPGERLVHWLGGGDAVESPWIVTERPTFFASWGMARAYADAFCEARLAPEDVHAFDLYSCFPSAVELGCRALGIEDDDARPLTVTGGLPYAGGPGNGYTTHAIATMLARLRSDPGAVGMTTGIGWYFSKHSAALYSTLPPMELPAASAPDRPEPPAPVAVAAEASGRGRLETYTVLHDREGAAELGIAVGRLEDGRRFLAFVDGGAEALASLEASEGVGRTGRVRPDGDAHRIDLD
jgi:acetyl-CoA C-acetyltransferase